mmetsp:Transcript_30844/g.75375  ORF Transcript_30844/g.75375 Transcript_30844/m.75375 type:complete len:80 (-) Transcript_30844:422-661(-)
MQAVRDACKSAVVDARVVDKYPIVVNVVHVDTGTVVWSGSQKNLFRKYGAKRTQAIKEIRAAVTKQLAAGDDDARAGGD